EAGASEVVALDLTPEMMALARRKLGGARARVHWVRHALPRPLPFREATFDLAVLGLVAEHILGGTSAGSRAGRGYSSAEHGRRVRTTPRYSCGTRPLCTPGGSWSALSRRRRS